MALGNSPHELSQLADLDLQHDLLLTLSEQTDWSVIADLLRRAGADVQQLQLTRLDRGVAVRCRLKCISPEGARAFTHALLDNGLAERAHVEHLVLAGARSAS
jgi:hypothetical protein